MEYQTFDKSDYTIRHYKELPEYRLFAKLKYIGFVLSVFFLCIAGISFYFDKNMQYILLFCLLTLVPLIIVYGIYIYLTKSYMPKAWELKLPERISFFDDYMETFHYFQTSNYAIEENAVINYIDIFAIYWRKSKELLEIYCYPDTAYMVHKRSIYKKNRTKKKTYRPAENCFTIYLSIDEIPEFLETIKEKTGKKIKIYN